MMQRNKTMHTKQNNANQP